MRGPELPGRPAPAAAIAAIGFVALFALYTRSNGFPYIYHTDEPGKVAQLVGGWRNFHHPQLSMTATDALRSLGFYDRTPQQAAVAGRMVSAAFAALAVVALALTAYLLAGPFAATAATLVIGLEPSLFEAAHYMKEDPALLLGIGGTFLALTVYERKPTPGRAAGIGLGCALAASGKYVGALMLAPGLVALGHGSGRRRVRLLAFGLAFVAVVVWVNHRAFAELPQAVGALRWELGRTVGASAPSRPLPHPKAWQAVALATPPAVWLFLAVFYLSLLAPGGRRPPWPALALFPPAYLLVLSFTPKANARYVLPILAVCRLLAVLGAAWLVAWVPPGRRRGAEQAVAFLLLTWVLVRPDIRAVRHLRREFREDSRAELVAWIAGHLPPDALIAEDRHARLGLWDQVEGGPPLRQRVLSAHHRLPELGTLDELRARGVGYLVLCHEDYGKLFRGGARPRDAELRAFYERVMREGQLLWEGDEGELSYLHPGLRLVRIGAAPDRATQAGGAP
jgi:Dolichyl-phosphate-mannose-protein mannosyltransferase